MSDKIVSEQTKDDGASLLRADASASQSTTEALPIVRHTPGPWRVDREFRKPHFVVERRDARNVAGVGEIFREADAHLIAAAPEMKELLEKWIVVSALQTFEDRERFRAEAQLAIAKAEGRQRHDAAPENSDSTRRSEAR